jgi:hypothetical protein
MLMKINHFYKIQNKYFTTQKIENFCIQQKIDIKIIKTYKSKFINNLIYF